MKLYADAPVRRGLQVAGDLGLLAWILIWIALGRQLHEATLALARPGRTIDGSATDLAERLRDAGRTVAGVPLVGDDVRAPFDQAGSAASGLAEAGRQQVEVVGTLATWLGLAVAAIPILAMVWLYLPPRVAFVRRATAGQRFLDAGADLDLFALRAMAHQPLHVLAGIDSDPAGAWRSGDAGVITRLACSS